MALFPASLNDFVNVLLPAVRQIVADCKDDDTEATIWCSHSTESIILGVKKGQSRFNVQILTKQEIENKEYLSPQFGNRLHAYITYGYHNKDRPLVASSMPEVSASSYYAAITGDA